ncbi:hypothetical protein V7O66_01205 [Methanolobus sp. ZRKC3]|uniref:hypothetical protein n=1 Tax=Methanolobus sp. ZRKC3 TaxID=3125786 RepID=UPI00324815CD
MKIRTITCIAVALMLATVFTVGAFAEPIQDCLKDGTCDNFNNDCDGDRLQDGTCDNYINNCAGDQLRDRSCDKCSIDCNGNQKHDRDRICQDL